LKQRVPSGIEWPLDEQTRHMNVRATVFGERRLLAGKRPLAGYDLFDRGLST